MDEVGGRKPSGVLMGRESCIRDINIAQCDIARLLQMAYISLRKHPDIATQIRRIADLAKTQRVENSALMSRFALTAKHFQEALIPMILEGVKLQVPSIITGGLETGLNWAKDMKEDTNKCSKYAERCYDLVTELSCHIEEEKQTQAILADYKTTEDVSGLVEASSRLGEVYNLFLQLNHSWNTMVLCISLLINATSAGRVYLGYIGREKVHQRFCLAIEKAKKGWCEFERICRWYHDVCEGDTANSNKHLYDFLSKPIEDMSKEEIQALQRAITDKLEADIEEARLGNA